MPRRHDASATHTADATTSAKEPAFSDLKNDGEQLSIGMIDPSLGHSLKAAAYVDLLLAPTGSAKIHGEPLAILQEVLGRDNLKCCSSDASEIIAASGGLMQLMGEGEQALASVRAALSQRPEALAVVTAFLAYTPFIGGEDVQPSEWSTFELGSFSYKDPERGEPPSKLTPEQSSVASSRASLGATAVLLCAVGGGKSMRAHVRRHFVGSRHFRNCMHRLVALIGRFNPEGLATAGDAVKADQARVSHQLAMIARDALCALCKEHRPCLDFVDEPALHPFMKNDVTARSLVAAIRVSSPLQLPKEGARHPDDPFLFRDYLQLLSVVGVLLLGVRYIVWPMLWFICMHIFSLPGRFLRWTMGAAVG